MGMTAVKVIKTLGNPELSHSLLGLVSNCRMMKMCMLPSGPSVLARLAWPVFGMESPVREIHMLQEAWLLVFWQVILFPLNQNEMNVLALEACMQYTVLPVECGSMVSFPHRGGQIHST